MSAVVLHVHFWADIRNSAGSVEKVITAFAAHGVGYDHTIACCPPAETSDGVAFRHHGVDVYPFNENRLLNRVMNKILGRGVFTYGSLVRLVNRLRPAILHVHNRQELVDALVSRLAYRPKVAVHYHRHFAEPVIPATADLLLFISRATAQDILGKTGSGKPYRILPNPLSVELLAHARTCATPTNRPPTVLFGGGANPIKGGRELVEAFRRCPAASARLILAGRGVEKFGVADPNIEVLGEVPADAFFARMRAADIVAMPSYDEPFGLIAQEAMLMRKLLVTTASGGLAEFVDADSAILVRPREIESLHDGLARALAVLRQPALLGGILDKAEARVRAFAPDTVALQLRGCYDQMIGYPS